MDAEIHDAPIHVPKKKYLLEEFYNQPDWSSTKAALAKLIHDLDRGDIPDRYGNVGCYAAVGTLADKINKTVRTTKRLLAELKAEGVLIDLGGTEGGTARRRIHLNYDVKDRVFARRKVTEVISGRVVTRRLKKSELPEPVFCGLKCHPRGVTCDTRNSILSELRNTPLSPFPAENGSVEIFSDSQSSQPLPAQPIPNPEPRRADGSSALEVHPVGQRKPAFLPDSRLSQAEATPAPAPRRLEASTDLDSQDRAPAQAKPRRNSRAEKHKEFHRRMMELPGVRLFFEDRFDLEKVSGADAALFMRRWDDGSINLDRLDAAWEGLSCRCASEFQKEAEKARTDTTFRSFVTSIDRSCGHAVRTNRRHVIGVIKNAMYCLGYAELRPMFEGSEAMTDNEFSEIMNEASHTLNDIIKGADEFLRTECQVNSFMGIQSTQLAKRTFDETRDRMNAPEVDFGGDNSESPILALPVTGINDPV